MTGFMICTDYSKEQGAFSHPVVVLDMYRETEKILSKIRNEAALCIPECDKDHPLVVCLHLGKQWTSYKTVHRLYTVLSLFRDSFKDNCEVNIIIDFTAETAETLSRFNLLRDFEILSGASLDVKEGYSEK